MAGVLPATLRVALRSKIAPGDFVNFRPLPPEGSASVVSQRRPIDLGEQELAKICC